jgi:hypothetical protein
MPYHLVSSDQECAAGVSSTVYSPQTTSEARILEFRLFILALVVVFIVLRVYRGSAGSGWCSWLLNCVLWRGKIAILVSFWFGSHAFAAAVFVTALGLFYTLALSNGIWVGGSDDASGCSLTHGSCQYETNTINRDLRGLNPDNSNSQPRKNLHSASSSLGNSLVSEFCTRQQAFAILGVPT